ncbi:phage tail tape measure protein [Gimesia algae]|uniref:hypothetical protein n=1 Tax=Gimesia algae TaxID=2527971 RepID=UPI0011A54B65|nr:hypothetical protein [Gimesia algae]
MELFTKDAKLRKGLDAAKQRLNAFGKFTAGIGVKMAAFGSAVLAPFGLAIKAGSDLQETMNKFNVVFGENSKAVKAWGDEYGKQVGRSERQIADFMASNQDLLVPMGFEEDAATNMSKQITQLSVDLASFNNMQDTDTLRDLQAALTGSGEVMKKYGVIVSQAAVNQELLNMKLDPKTATEAEKAQARFNIILRGTTAAQGDAIRSADSWANQKKALAAQIENVAGKIGNVLLPVVTPLLMQVNKGVELFGGFIEKNQELVKYVALGGVVLLVAGAAFLTLGGMAIFAGAAIGGLTTMMALAGTVIGAVLSPVGLLTAAVVGGAGALLYYTGVGGKAIAWIKDQFSGLGGTVSKVFAAIKNAMAAGDYKKAAEILWLGIKVAFLAGTNQLMAKVGEWKAYFLNIWYGTIDDASKYFIDSWANLRSNWESVTQFFGDAWDTVMNRVQKVWSVVGGSIINGIGHTMNMLKVLNPALMKVLPSTGEFRFRAKEATGANLTSEEIDNATNASIANRNQGSEKNLREIENTRSGANQAVDGDAQGRIANQQQSEADAKQKANDELAAAQTALADAMREASNELSDSAEKTKNGETKTEQAAKAANAPGGSLKEASQSISGGSGDLRSKEGIDTLAKLINMTGEKTVQEDQLTTLKRILTALSNGQQVEVLRSS